MSTTTTKRQWYKPALTDAPPNIVTATSFLDEMDDVGMVFYGTFAARPAATASNGHGAGNPGSLYYATDTNQLFVSAAGTWRQLPISGLAQILTGDIADNAVTTAKIGANQVTAAKIEAQQAWQNITPSGAGVTWSTIDTQYYKDSLGLVHMRGRATASGFPTTSSTILTFPVGFRPTVGNHLPLIPFFDGSVAATMMWEITTAGSASIGRYAGGNSPAAPITLDFSNMTPFRAV